VQTEGKGALVLEVVGGTLFKSYLDALSRGGRQIAISSNSQAISFNLVDFLHGLHS
jgi:NADPH:quinone reductase-like Zn-dependent oxidoreductase